MRKITHIAIIILLISIIITSGCLEEKPASKTTLVNVTPTEINGVYIKVIGGYKLIQMDTSPFDYVVLDVSSKTGGSKIGGFYIGTTKTFRLDPTIDVTVTDIKPNKRNYSAKIMVSPAQKEPVTEISSKLTVISTQTVEKDGVRINVTGGLLHNAKTPFDYIVLNVSFGSNSVTRGFRRGDTKTLNIGPGLELTVKDIIPVRQQNCYAIAGEIEISRTPEEITLLSNKPIELDGLRFEIINSSVSGDKTPFDYIELDVSGITSKTAKFHNGDEKILEVGGLTLDVNVNDIYSVYTHEGETAAADLKVSRPLQTTSH